MNIEKERKQLGKKFVKEIWEIKKIKGFMNYDYITGQMKKKG